MIGDGLNPLTMSQLPSDASQTASGSVTMAAAAETCGALARGRRMSAQEAAAYEFRAG
jgi:hypothetical protein